MQLYGIQDLTNNWIVTKLEDEFSNIYDPNLVKNYHPDYKHEPSNLFYILSQTENRYKKGMYYVLLQDSTFICSAGWNEYELDHDVALALTRAYVSPEFRTKYFMGQHILPEIIKQTRSYKHLYITSNSYNIAIFNWFDRSAKGKLGALFNNWPDIYKKFKPKGKQSIYYTDQYVLEYIE